MPGVKKEAIPYDKGWAWMVVLGCFINNFCLLGVIKSFGMIIQEMKTVFHLPSSVAVLMSSLSSVIFVLFAMFSTSLAEYYSHRRVVMVGGILGCMAYSLSSLMFSMVYVTCVYGILFGLCLSCSYASNFVMVNKYFKKYRSIANGIGLCGSGIGQLSVPLLIQYLLDTYAIRGTLLILGGFLLHLMLGGFLYRPLSYYSDPSSPAHTDFQDEKEIVEPHAIQDEETEEIRSETTSDEKKLVSDFEVENNEFEELGPKESSNSQINNIQCTKHVKPVGDLHDNVEAGIENELEESEKMLKSNGVKKKSLFERYKFLQIFDLRVILDIKIFFYIIVIFLIFIGNFNFLQFLPMRAVEKEAEHYEKAMLISLCGIGDVVGRLAAGAIGNLNVMRRHCLMGIASIVAGLNVIVFNFANEYWWMCIHAILFGYFGGHYSAMLTPVLIDFVGIEKMPKCVGVLVSVQGIGAATTQPLLGLVEDVTGTFSPVILLTATFMLCGGIMLLFYPLIEKSHAKKEERRKEENNLTTELEG